MPTGSTAPTSRAVIGDPTADRARFDVVIECGERCDVTFRYDAIDAMVVLVDGRTPPEVVVDPAAVGVVDFATRGPEPRPLQAARLRLFDGLFWLSDYLLVGVLLVFGAVAVRGVRRTGWSATGALVVAVLVIGIGSRLATVALVDALLFDAIRAQYLLPAGFLAYALPFGLSALGRAGAVLAEAFGDPAAEQFEERFRRPRRAHDRLRGGPGGRPARRGPGPCRCSRGRASRRGRRATAAGRCRRAGGRQPRSRRFGWPG